MWTLIYEHGFIPHTCFYQFVGDFYAHVKTKCDYKYIYLSKVKNQGLTTDDCKGSINIEPRSKELDRG